MGQVKIIVEFTVETSEIEDSRKTFHEGRPLSDEAIFADDLQEYAYNVGCQYGQSG